MEFYDLIQRVIHDTLDTSLPLFWPELILCLTIFVLLAARVVSTRIEMSFPLAIAGLLLALLVPQGGQPWRILLAGDELVRTEIFTGMLVYDGFTLFMRGLLISFAILLLVLTRITNVFDRRDGTDIYTLVIGATLGMCLMASANHLLMVFLAVEIASVPSYVLAGMRKTQRLSSEAALKYSVYGAGTAGVMLYGISLVAGVVNSVHLPTISDRLVEIWPTLGMEQSFVLALGGLMIMVGLAFKLSAVPFHFWCPDVFEGASAEVNAFLSVASKAAALALLVRVSFGIGIASGTLPGAESVHLTQERGGHSVAQETESGNLLSVTAAVLPGQGDEAVTERARRVTETTATLVADSTSTEIDEQIASSAKVYPVPGFIALMISVLAAITCTFGNLAAYGQTNINRLLAYSTIAHAGYMMMAVPAALAVAHLQPESAETAIASMVIYLVIYLFMNLGAFAIVAFLREALQSERIDDYRGLFWRAPGLVVCLGLIFFSLVGLPPLAGFVGKFAVFAALMDGYRLTEHGYLFALLIVGGVNTAISLFYYLRVVKVMVIDPEPEGRSPFEFSLVSPAGVYALLVTVPVVLFFLRWDWLSRLARSAADHLLS